MYEIYDVIDSSKKKFSFDLSILMTKYVHFSVCGKVHETMHNL